MTRNTGISKTELRLRFFAEAESEEPRIFALKRQREYDRITKEMNQKPVSLCQRTKDEREERV